MGVVLTVDIMCDGRDGACGEWEYVENIYSRDEFDMRGWRSVAKRWGWVVKKDGDMICPKCQPTKEPEQGER